MAIICLIGSARFESAFHEAETQLTQMGHVVLSKDPIALARRKAEGEFDVVEVEMFSLVHLEKIRQSDVVLIINGDDELGAHPPALGYIGESTAREIIWARVQNKILISRQELSGWGHLADLIDERYAIENGVGLRLMIDARNVLSKVNGMAVVSEVIHSDRLSMFHAALSVLATNGGDASKAYASSVLGIAGVDIMVDMPALMPMFQDPPSPFDVTVDRSDEFDQSNDATSLPTMTVPRGKFNDGMRGLRSVYNMLSRKGNREEAQAVIGVIIETFGKF